MQAFLVYYNIFSPKVKLLLQNSGFPQLFAQKAKIYYVNSKSKYVGTLWTQTQYLVKMYHFVNISPIIMQPAVMGTKKLLWKPKNTPFHWFFPPQGLTFCIFYATFAP